MIDAAPLRFAATLIAIVTAALVGGCASFEPGADGPQVEAPVYRVGDRWEYHVADGFRVLVEWDEIHEVTAIGPAGITMRVTQRGRNVDNERLELWEAPGLVRVGALFDEETRRFVVPLKRYDFPLARGKSWSQRVDNEDLTAPRKGEIAYFGLIGGWEKVSSPAGHFDAMRMRIYITLDDDEPWRWPTQCDYIVWYSPAVHGIVRETKEAYYVERGHDAGVAAIRSQHATVELVRFTPGAG